MVTGFDFDWFELLTVLDLLTLLGYGGCVCLVV